MPMPSPGAAPSGQEQRYHSSDPKMFAASVTTWLATSPPMGKEWVRGSLFASYSDFAGGGVVA